MSIQEYAPKRCEEEDDEDEKRCHPLLIYAQNRAPLKSRLILHGLLLTSVMRS